MEAYVYVWRYTLLVVHARKKEEDTKCDVDTCGCVHVHADMQLCAALRSGPQDHKSCEVLHEKLSTNQDMLYLCICWRKD